MQNLTMDFFVIGAPKSGTTAIHHYLSSHPDLYLPTNKELNYFAFMNKELRFEGPGDMDSGLVKYSKVKEREYFRQFLEAEDKLKGEVAPHYIHIKGTAQRIYENNPNAKIIAILRNPVDRAYSNFLHNVKMGRETESFSGAIHLEEERIKSNWSPAWNYSNIGYYAHHLKEYLKYFSQAQFKIILYENFRENPKVNLKSIFEFLKVDDYSKAIDTNKKFNESNENWSTFISKTLKGETKAGKLIRNLIPVEFRKDVKKLVARANQKHKPTMDITFRRELFLLYREDILELERIFNLDLSGWKL